MGIYQYFGELKVSCSRTLHGDRGVRTLNLQRSTTRPARTTVLNCDLLVNRYDSMAS